KRLYAARAARNALARHKLLLSYLSNSAYERLVIDELNLVLEGSGFEAKDTIEQYIEDFEVVGPEIRVIAEAKAMGPECRISKRGPNRPPPDRACLSPERRPRSLR